MTKSQKKNLSPVVQNVINEMQNHATKWIAPCKTVFRKRIKGKEVQIIRSYYDPEQPVSLFIDKKEVDNLSEKEFRILSFEFQKLRQKFEAYISKRQDTERLLKIYNFD